MLKRLITEAGECYASIMQGCEVSLDELIAKKLQIDTYYQGRFEGVMSLLMEEESFTKSVFSRELITLYNYIVECEVEVNENSTIDPFIEKVYEYAFGADAIHRDFTKEQVLEALDERMAGNIILDVYRDDFQEDSTFKEVCETCGVEESKTDKITIYGFKVETNV